MLGLSLFACLASIGAALGPPTVEDLVKMAYPETYAKMSKFYPLKSSPWVYVANNDTALMKIVDFTASSYPLHPGELHFNLENILESEFPKGTTMDIVGFVNDKIAVNTTLDMCDYMAYGELFCPLPKHGDVETVRQSLLVPQGVISARYSFVATLKTAEDELVAQVAALVDMLESDPASHTEL